MSVLPAVAGVDRPFDYLVAPDQDTAVRVGTLVRVDLHGRRVGGWVVGPAPSAGGPEGLRELRPLARVSGWGPEPEVVRLAEWAAWRWAGRRGSFLRTASPGNVVAALPPADRRPPAPPAGPRHVLDLAGAALASSSPVVVRLPPVSDPTALVAAVAQRGPTLVVVPSVARAAVLAGRLRRAGAGVALVPQEWGRARAGAGVVVGARAAAWAPCPGLAGVVVLDAHDEGLVQDQAPTWWAARVAAERARRAGAPCIWVTPCPPLDLLAAAGPPLTLPVDRERGGWTPIEVVDRSADDPRLGLWSERLVRVAREGRRVVCVLNRTGRARLLACGSCAAIARCESCGAAVSQPASGELPPYLACARCGTTRPQVCLVCHSTRMRRLRLGVERAREELEALLGSPVAEVTATTDSSGELGGGGPLVVVGTEAVLHRVPEADVVAFVDFDQELLAPRVRAAEEALALLARASRVLGGRRPARRLLVQTTLPDHEVLLAASRGDASLLSAIEDSTRAALRLPPHSALAVVSGAQAAPYAAAIGEVAASLGVELARPGPDRWVLRAHTVEQLCDALASVPRPPGRLRVEVDPVRF